MTVSTTDSYVSIVGSYKLDPQDAPAFAKIAAESVAQTVNKPGCIYYIISQDLTEAGVFYLSEGWATQAALDAHATSPDFQKTLQEALKLRILGRQIYVSQSTGRTLLGN